MNWQIVLVAVGVVAVGVPVIVVLIHSIVGRVHGRTGDTETFLAQLQSQMLAFRGSTKPKGTPPWDGENRSGTPETDVVW